MVQFYQGTEISKKLQLSNSDRDKCYEFINNLIDYIFLNREKKFPNGFHPLFDLMEKLNISNIKINTIEKILKFHLLSSDYRGYKFLEYLITVEAILSILIDEHPYQIYHKLISYLGEDYILNNNLNTNKENYFKNKYLLSGIQHFKKSENIEDLKTILSLSSKQLEYLLFDLNPLFVMSGLRLLPEEYKNKILSCYTDFNQDNIFSYSVSEDFNAQMGEEFIKFLIMRLNKKEKNSFELRRENYYYSRLYKGNELTYRLKTNHKQKSQLKEIILVFLSIAGKVKEVGFKNSREFLDFLSSDEFFYLKAGLTYVLEGWHPANIRYILENQILVGDYKGIDFLKRLLILDGCHALALNISENIMLEKFIQTIGEENRNDIQKYITEATNVNN